MQEKLTECQERLLERYLDQVETDGDRSILLSVGMGANSFGFEQEIMEFLDSHPAATLEELDEYADQFFPELVVEDD